MKREFHCDMCGRTSSTPTTCCGRPMQEQKLEPCSQPQSAESFRAADSDEPCDDGRKG